MNMKCIGRAIVLIASCVFISGLTSLAFSQTAVQEAQLDSAVPRLTELRPGEVDVQKSRVRVPQAAQKLGSLSVVLGVLSDFVPTSHFACMMFAMLLTALFADLILLPALLLGPLGVVFSNTFDSPLPPNKLATIETKAFESV